MTAFAVKFAAPFLATLAAAAILNAQTAAPNAATPRLVCAEPQFDFGTLSNTNEVKHEFILRNAGDAPLEIARVEPDCGCTLVSLKDYTLQPGARTTLAAKLTLTGRHSKQRKRITLETNDPENRRCELWLIGEAIAEMEVEPQQIYWGNLGADATNVQTVELRFHAAAPFHLASATSSVNHFRAEIEAVETGKFYRVAVRPVPPLPPGPLRFHVDLATDNPRFFKVVISNQGRVVGALFPTPDEIILDPKSDRPLSRLVLVQSAARTNFNILKVVPPDTNITVQVRPLMTSGYRIDLRNIVVTPALDGRKVVVTTDCEAMLELAIPLRVTPDAEYLEK